MNWQSRFKRPRTKAEAGTADGGPGKGAIDPETGEITSPPAPSQPNDVDTGNDSVVGERSIPSVNRERSMQSRVSGILALCVMLLLGAGFLFWYYSQHFSAARDAEAAAKRLAAERAGGDSKVPPLGRVDPPLPEPSSSTVAPQPPPVQATASQPPVEAGPPAKSPEQILLERQLGQPVLRRAEAQSGALPSFTANAVAGVPMNVVGTGTGSQGIAGAGPLSGGNGGTLATNLKPTPTPAVSAQLLPTRRFLLPKGAFVDCTLETAIDSTYEGMTTCIGASDIYSADGKVVLLERGTKYVGEQRGSPQQGQGRVFVLWSEARTPTGVVVQLASPGTDQLGRNGLPGFVDTHFWDRFGAAILISVIDGTVQALAASQQRGSGGNTGGAIVIGPQGRDVVTEVLRNSVAIPPTVVKNQGERIQILVARDVDFRSVYALRSDTTP